MTSSTNDFTERLRRRLETERREIEELTASELERLAENSRCGARSALRTIKRDTEEETDRMRELLLRACLRPLVFGLSIWLGIFAGIWATMRWLSKSIQDRIEMLLTANLRIEGARRLLGEIEETTWGMTLRQVSEKRYLTLPVGTPVRPAFTVDGRPQLKLSRERKVYDCVRRAVDEGVEEVVRAVREGTAAAVRADRLKLHKSKSNGSTVKWHACLSTPRRSPRCRADAGSDAPTWAGALSWPESMMVLGREF